MQERITFERASMAGYHIIQSSQLPGFRTYGQTAEEAEGGLLVALGNYLRERAGQSEGSRIVSIELDDKALS